MAKDNQLQMPGVFGGLMRYNEEYKSTLMMKPQTVIIFIVALGLAVIALKIIFPIAPFQGASIPVSGLMESLLI